ncbi:MAG: CpaF family protein [Acidimicrobiaceae bacterium]|nr:CpaF family protein [Acidimicrobiaceae bacterium]
MAETTPKAEAPLLDLAEAVHGDLLDQGGGTAEIFSAIARHAPLLGARERESLHRQVTARLAGLGSIEPLLVDREISEIMINGPGVVWLERNGRIEPSGVVLNNSELELLVERIVAPIGRIVDPRRPWVDGRLADGSRVNIVAPPVAIDGPYVTIRRFVLRAEDVSDFGPPDVASMLSELVKRRRSIIVSGGTGAGKTSLLNALAAHVASEARVITVEDAAELRLQHPHVVRLEARAAGVEGVGAVEIRDLLRNALRMRPDRIVLGEVRGPEALDLIQALNTGHSGCLSTIHANSPTDALRRLSSLVMSAGTGLPHDAIRAQIGSAVDVVVQVERTASEAREVAAIVEVVDGETVRPLWCGE